MLFCLHFLFLHMRLLVSLDWRVQTPTHGQINWFCPDVRGTRGALSFVASSWRHVGVYWPYRVSVSVSPSLECLLEFPCQWNYRPDHCIYGSNCMSAEEEGIYILHGNRGVYHDHKQPAFKAVYEAIRKVSIPRCVFVCSNFDNTKTGSVKIELQEDSPSLTF